MAYSGEIIKKVLPYVRFIVPQTEEKNSYRLQGDSQFITPQDERLIISGIKQVQGGKYTDLTNKCSEPILRVSQNPPNTPLNNKLNCNLYMNKKLIRLTESDLHRIVKESVYSLLEYTKPTNEGIENETSFLPYLKRTYENLYREYEHWQYATYKPQGMDDAINAIIAAMHSVQDIIREIEPNDNIPTLEDPQQY